MTARWLQQELDGARREGDRLADELAARVFAQNREFLDTGRLGYNYLLWVADTLLGAPGLSLVSRSTIATELACYPRELVDYFSPIEAPAWVEPDKLERAATLWEENALAIIGALYVASLPACYLLTKGITVLYQTAKLADHRYISQRIYETGLFVEAVMSRGGLQIFTDIPKDLRQYVGQGPAPSPPKRYVWGKGFVFARQVRFLHASMRFMLTHPELAAPLGARKTVAESVNPSEWKQYAGDGETPINQEDLAYTLLTFAYLIPRGLATWGCRWSAEDKAAFLHLWKLVGYVMGIQERFLTDTWGDAERLFTIIRERLAGTSPIGRDLAETVMDVLKDYLPSALGIAESVPPALITHQLGETYAAMILTPERQRAARRPFTRVTLRTGLVLLWIYYGIRSVFFRRFKTLAAFMGSVFSEAGDELINSWRDEYERRPFDVPPDAGRIPPLSAESLTRLRAWRQKLVFTLAAGIGLLVASTLGAGIAVALFCLAHPEGAKLSVWIALGCFVLAVATLKGGLARVSRQRPDLHGATTT